MTSTVFVDKTTLIEAPWLNDVDALVYQGQLENGTTGASISQYLPAGTGAVPTTVQTVLRREIWVEDFGAVGDDPGTDDTLAIQAAIDYACNNSLTLRFMAKTYYVSAGLIIGGPGVLTFTGSVVLVGSQAGLRLGDGTQIMLTGSGHASMLEMTTKAYRNCRVEHITFRCQTSPALDVYPAERGLYISDTSFYGHLFDDLSFYNARTTIEIAYGVSANGEFCTFSNVRGFYAQTYFKMSGTAGQSFGHMFYGGAHLAIESLQGSPYYRHFELGIGSGGYGLNVTNFSATTVRTLGSLTPATYLTLLGDTGPMYFQGGRVEGLTSVVSVTGLCNAVFDTIDFAGIYTEVPAAPFVLSSGISYGNFEVRNCLIPLRGGSTLRIELDRMDQTAYIFSRCTFVAQTPVQQVAFDVTAGSTGAGSVTFEECSINRAGTNDTTSMNRRYGVSPPLRQSFANDVYDSLPENLILQSNFGGIAPLSPWVASEPFADYLTGINGQIALFSSSPYAAYFTMNPGMTVYQDIYTVTAVTQIVNYVAAFSPVSVSSNRVSVSLSNPTTGEIYDVATTANNSNLVKLQAQTVSASGVIRLTWEAPSTNVGTTIVRLSWQTASTNAFPSFVNTTTATKKFAHNWGSVSALRVFARLSLPYVPRTAVELTTLANVESDIAISSLSNRVIYYANGRGNELPNQDVGSAAPTTLTYPLGWIRYNSAPAPSGTIGWVCTTAGTMGTLNGGATTGSITTGTAALAVSATTGLLVGQMITIAGVSGIKTITGLVPTATTGSITTGLASLVLASVTNYVVGTAITIAGVTGTKYIISVIGNTVILDTPADATVTGAAVTVAVANSITINSTANATVAGAAVAFSAGVWKTFGAISA